MKLLPPYREKFIVMALENLITNKIPLIDKFGYTVYLREDRSRFYLDRNYPTGSRSASEMSYYTENIISIKTELLSNVLSAQETKLSNEVLENIRKIADVDLINEYLDSLSLEGQANILEEIIIEALEKDTKYFFDETPKPEDNYVNIIINKYRDFILWFPEPVNEVREATAEALQPRIKQGRKPDPNKKKHLEKYNNEELEEIRRKMRENRNNEIVYLNVLDSQDIGTTAYNLTAKVAKGEGKVRILKMSEIGNGSGWRDLNSIEIPIYNQYQQAIIAERNEKFLKDNINFIETGIYGTLLADGKFRIVDKQLEDPKAITKASSQKRGIVCATCRKPYLIDVMWRIGVKPPELTSKYEEVTELNRAEIIEKRLAGTKHKKINKTEEEMLTWDLDQLDYYNRWYEADISISSVKYICGLIKEKMDELGLIKDYIGEIEVSI
jgi:hypothetical protein